MRNKWAKNEEIMRKQIVEAVDKVLLVLNQRPNESFSVALRRAADPMIRWFISEGPHGLKRWKTISNYLIRKLLCSKSYNPRPPHKVPRLLWFLYFKAKGNGARTEALISVLMFHRIIKADIDLSVDSITAGFGGSILAFLRRFYRLADQCSKVFRSAYNVKRMESYQFRWVISGSGGPNGSPSWQMAEKDFLAIGESKIKWAQLMWLCAHPILRKWDLIKKLYGLYSKAKNSKVLNIPQLRSNLCHSRLAFLSDKAGKTRVVAMGDILSQSLLKPIHDRVTSILKLIKNDGTHDQDKAASRVKEWSKKGMKLYSIDMRSCTDRLPALVQCWFMWRIGVMTFFQSLSWWFLTCWRSFKVQTNKPRSKRRVARQLRRRKRGILYKFIPTFRNLKYSVGQPMGLYSSWPIMALTNHLLVRTSFMSVYGESKKSDLPYVIIGDDVVIADEKAALAYISLLEVLGVEVAREKSFMEEGLAEFAKRLFKDGHDRSPIPFKVLQPDPAEIVGGAVALSMILARKGYSLSFEEFVAIVSKGQDTTTRRRIVEGLISPGLLKSMTWYTPPLVRTYEYQPHTEYFEHAVATFRIKRDLDNYTKLERVLYKPLPRFLSKEERVNVIFSGSLAYLEENTVISPLEETVRRNLQSSLDKNLRAWASFRKSQKEGFPDRRFAFKGEPIYAGDMWIAWDPRALPLGLRWTDFTGVNFVGFKPRAWKKDKLRKQLDLSFRHMLEYYRESGVELLDRYFMRPPGHKPRDVSQPED